MKKDIFGGLKRLSPEEKAHNEYLARRVYYVDVGSLPKHEAEQIVDDVMASHKLVKKRAKKKD